MVTTVVVSLMIHIFRYRDTSLAMCEYTPLAQGDLNDSEEELFPCNSGSVSVRCVLVTNQNQSTHINACVTAAVGGNISGSV